MNPSVQVSVIVPSYNRSESLKDTLQGLGRQKTSLHYEIIVVDNNSTDGTKEVVREFQGNFKAPLYYLFESRQGISYARNAGMRKARGELIAFLDDDTLPSPEWLTSFWRCFQEEEADLVAGKVELLWFSERPEWLSEILMKPLVTLDYGEKRFQIHAKEKRILGANFAFRRSLADRVGFFREDLGRRGNSLIGGEDSEWFGRLIQEKAKVFYEPQAQVFHKVLGEKITEEYILRWFLDIGRTHGHLMDWKWHHGVTLLPLWCWKGTLYSRMRETVSDFSRQDKTQRLEAKTQGLFYQGILQERSAHWQNRVFRKSLSCHFI